MITAETVRQAITKEIILTKRCSNTRNLMPAYVTYRNEAVLKQIKLQSKIEVGDEILKLVSEITNVPIFQITGKCRKQEYVNVRKIAQYLIYTYTTCTLKDVGLFFGGTHWSTIIHAKQKLFDLIETEPNYKRMLQACEQSVSIRFKKQNKSS